MARRALTLVVAAVAACSLAGCGTSGLSFRLDERVTLRAPADHADVTLPLTIRWDVKDFAVGDGAGSFGVLIDRTPPPAGESLSWLFRNDDSCAAGCPDAAYRAQRGVVATRDTKVVLDEISTVGQRRDGEGHEVIVILLDADGRRVGEGAWSRQFNVARGNV